MKKNILLLYPYRFTEFEYYKYEIEKLEKGKNLKIIINDLSSIISNKKHNDQYKAKIEKKTIKFHSLISWIIYFKKLKKKNTVIYNFLDTSNFNSFIITLFIKLSKLPVIFYEEEEDGARIPKKNILFFINKIKEHGLNFKVYLFYFKYYLFNFLSRLHKYKKVYVLSRNIEKKSFKGQKTANKENFVNIESNTYDFSNAILNKKKKILKKYVIFLDRGGPYFSGDTHEKGNKEPKFNNERYYKDLNNFFDKIENYFNATLIIIPHPKYKSPNPSQKKTLIPYFANRNINNEYDSLAKLSAHALFFISEGSTAASYAIVHYKPILHIYSPDRKKIEPKAVQNLMHVSMRNTGKKAIDISTINKKKIIKNLIVNKSKYNFYKYSHLTPKSKKTEKTPNYKIIRKILKNLNS